MAIAPTSPVSVLSLVSEVTGLSLVSGVLSCQVVMPTPGWTLRVDGVVAGQVAGSFDVRITALRPTGIVTQVLTPTALKVTLGALSAGRHLVTLYARVGTTAPYTLLHAVVVEAKSTSTINAAPWQDSQDDHD